MLAHGHREALWEQPVQIYIVCSNRSRSEDLLTWVQGHIRLDNAVPLSNPCFENP